MGISADELERPGAQWFRKNLPMLATCVLTPSSIDAGGVAVALAVY
jgi:hypothetical protein